jgi:putative flippase GtrA
MKLLSPRDIRSAIITGLTTGIIAWRVFLFLGNTDFFGLPLHFLPAVVPLAWLAGVQFGYLLGQRIRFFEQFGRFAAIGFTNFAVDAAILNILISSYGITSGIYFALFKGISTCVALLHSYYWNRTWSFEQKTAAGAGEFIQFALVALSSIIVNVGVATLVASLPHDQSSAIVWANIASMAGAACSLVFSFIGFRLLVFKR